MKRLPAFSAQENGKAFPFFRMEFVQFLERVLVELGQVVCSRDLRVQFLNDPLLEMLLLGRPEGQYL